MKRSVVLPVYNEQGSVASTLASIAAEVANWEDCEILVCDNASTDDTRRIVEQLANDDPRIRLIPAERNRLYAWNVGRGIEAATGEHVFVLDGDGQYPSEVMQRLDVALESGSDLVLGYRVRRVGGFVRVVASHTYLALCRLYLGFDKRDINAGARGLSRRLADVVHIRHEGTMANPELYAIARSHGMSISEVSVGHEHRIAGETSHAFSKPLDLISQAVKYFTFLRRIYMPLGRPRLLRRRAA